MKKYLKLFAAVLLSFFVINMALAQNTNELTIVGVAMRDKNLTTFVKAVKAAGLVNTLKGTGPYTVFAPTNAAFAKLPKDTLNNLLNNKALLAAILTYHVVPGKIMAVNVQSGPMSTLQGQSITLGKTPAGVQVNNANVVRADVSASNGVVQEIDTVLIPSNVDLNQVNGMQNTNNNSSDANMPQQMNGNNAPENSDMTPNNNNNNTNQNDMNQNPPEQQNSGYMNGDQTQPNSSQGNQ